MSQEQTDIIIPTFNNKKYVVSAVSSILCTRLISPLRIILVNNGDKSLQKSFAGYPNLEFVQASKNLGWVGGLELGLQHSNSEYILFCNDDIFVPLASCLWLRAMLEVFNKLPNIGAVGPSSNYVSGKQNIFHNIRTHLIKQNYLIGFCFLTKRDILEEIGGLDNEFDMYGDDLELSIRLVDAGYELAIRNDIFIYHHGSIVGARLYKDWNSPATIKEIERRIVKKHGQAKWDKLFA